MKKKLEKNLLRWRMGHASRDSKLNNSGLFSTDCGVPSRFSNFQLPNVMNTQIHDWTDILNINEHWPQSIKFQLPRLHRFQHKAGWSYSLALSWTASALHEVTIVMVCCMKVHNTTQILQARTPYRRVGLRGEKRAQWGLAPVVGSAVLHTDGRVWAI